MPLDTSQSQKFRDMLKEFPQSAVTEAVQVMKKGAQEAKKNLQDDAKSSRHFGQIAPSISYDTTVKAHSLEIELGPDKDRSYQSGGKPGALANLAYFGGANGGGGTLDFDEPVEREFPVIDLYMRELGDKL